MKRPLRPREEEDKDKENIKNFINKELDLVRVILVTIFYKNVIIRIYLVSILTEGDKNEEKKVINNKNKESVIDKLNIREIKT